MICPFCRSQQVYVKNSRPTKGGFQIWRRKHCQNCGEIFTTHEIIDLSHLVVIKKSGKKERFSHAKLYSGIYRSAIGYRGCNRENMVDQVTGEIEKEILILRKKEITTQEISEIILNQLKSRQSGTFLRFLAYNKEITNEIQLKKEIAKYLG
jgi:transcriptional repressor NrdR